MFYLTKRVDEKQCTVGDQCMVLADFSGIAAGTQGYVQEVYHEGVMIEWVTGERRPADGFSREELEYLAFATLKHPRVDATVYNHLTK